MTDLGLISEEGHNNQTSTIMAIILPTQGEPLIKSSCRVAIMSGEREITYSDLLRYANLYAKYIPTEKGTKTIILGENREGWFFALYAVWCNEGVVIPVDAAATPDDVAYIINDAEPECIWTTSARKDLVAEALNLVGKDIRVNIIDDYENADVSEEKEADIRLRLEDLALICYTSGTTGSPKGVMLTYENIMVNVRAVSSEVEIYNAERRTLVLLPLHHVLPLVGTVVMPMIIGGGVAICPSLSAADIMTTLKRGEIGLMIGVPRLWQTLYRGIKAKIDASPVTRGLFNICRKADNRTLSRTIFKSVHKKLGGHITYLVSGGAALDNETAIGLKTLGLDVLEGYGMTEAAPMIAFTRPDDIVPGSVGLPIHGCEVIVINGELCARGKNVMSGYYKREKETADIIDKNGWLHTGDLGRIDEKGRIFITGRMKEIIVLSNGKNVNPTEIEHKIEEYADIGGVPLRIIDTAGIRATEDAVERIGVEKARAHVKSAALVLALFDGSRPLEAEDEEILALLEGKDALIIVTKSDLPRVLDTERLQNLAHLPLIEITTKEEEGISPLAAAILEKVYDGEERLGEGSFVADLRTKNLLEAAADHLTAAISTMDQGLGLDFISIDLRSSLEKLGEITGETVGDDVLDEIFSRFCVGK